MAKPMTSSELIASIKRRAMIPSAQSTFQNADFLAFMNEEMALGMVPTINRQHEDYYLFTEPVPIVSQQSEYSIPYRATGNKLREVSFQDDNGNLFEMARIMIDDLPDYNGVYQVNRVRTFYVKNNKIVVVPAITGAASGKLLMSYYLSPNTLVMDTEGSIITNINTVTGEINVSSIPSKFDTSIKYDLISSKSPNVSLKISINATIVNPVTNLIQFDPSDLPSDLEIGDYINQEGEAFVPQMPSDLHVMLAHRVASRCLEALGDSEGLKNANSKLQEMETNLEQLLDNRVEASPMKVVNRHGLLRQGLFRRRYKWRI